LEIGGIPPASMGCLRVSPPLRGKRSREGPGGGACSDISVIPA
jgi:hypothetical protein